MESFLFWLQVTYAVLMYVSILVCYMAPVFMIRRKQNSTEKLGWRMKPELDHLIEDGKQKVGQETKHNGNNGNHSQSSHKLISRCNCIGSGIFIAICFLGLMPVVEKEFNALANDLEFIGSYPFAELSVVVGLFLVLILEQLFITCRRSSKPPVLLLEEDADADGSCHTHTGEAPKTNAAPMEINDFDGGSHGHCHNVDVSSCANESSFSIFILMFATSIHSVFEGLALGLQKDSSTSIRLFIGIILHECLVAFALGINSARIDMLFSKNLKFGLVFGSTVPLGIILGVGVGYTPGLIGKIISAIFQGLAAGTFLHVTFMELVPSELLNVERFSDPKLFKITLMVIGFSMMASLNIFTVEHHN